MPQMMPLMWTSTLIFLILITISLNSKIPLLNPPLNKNTNNKLFHSNSPLFLMFFY